MSGEISSRQCRRARALLKWNIPDLANLCRLSAGNIERFENNKGGLRQDELATLRRVFEKHELEFTSHGEVKHSKPVVAAPVKVKPAEPAAVKAAREARIAEVMAKKSSEN